MIGREAELSVITDRLRERRLVTLVGPGGIGKTTLAREAAAASAAVFGEGSVFVDLTRVDTGEGVRESLATQLGYSSFRALVDAPGDHAVLLVVDNCEHVADVVADALGELLDACRRPTVLATSRTALELPGEVVIPVGPLALPPRRVHEGPAVELFVQRARDAGADIEASEVVAELCRRLDGVPLAIELAAARTRSMTPDEVLERLVAGLDVLDRPRRRSAARHQSLRAAIEWSYDLLEPEEQDLFQWLTVFSGPFTAELAQAVAGETAPALSTVQDRLDGLVAASMVVATAEGGTTWYRVLDTVRAFGRARLEAAGRRAEAEARFAGHLASRAVDILARGATSWSADALSDLLALYGNLTAAVRWSLAAGDRPDRAMLLCGLLWGVVHQAHTEEVGQLAEEVLARWPDSDDPLRADTAATAATCRYMLGDNAGAIALAREALEIAPPTSFAQATLRRAIAQASRAAGEVDAALDAFAATAEAARRAGLVAMATEADSARAQVLADVGRTDGALSLVRAARAEAEAGGSEVGATWARAIEGSVLLRVDPTEARRVLEEALAEARRIRYLAAISVVLRALAIADLLEGDLASAVARISTLLDDLLARGSTYELRLVIDVTSSLLHAAGRTEAAADLAATALSLPVVSITASVGHELFPLDPAGGRVLPVRQAILVTRAELGALLAGDDVTTQPARLGNRVGTFRRAGDHWEVGFEGEVTTLRSTKGMADLAILLVAPGREVHCLELAGSTLDEADTGPVLDERARRAYETRVRELQQELDEAEDANDIGRAERARAELDALVDQLTEALGLGGRARSAGGAAERARSAVTQRIRATIKKLDEVHPALARHLRASVRTGVFCVYDPETPVRWTVESSGRLGITT